MYNLVKKNGMMEIVELGTNAKYTDSAIKSFGMNFILFKKC